MSDIDRLLREFLVALADGQAETADQHYQTLRQRVLAGERPSIRRSDRVLLEARPDVESERI